MRQAQDNFSREIDLLCRLSHPYVLRMFGICADNPTRFMTRAQGGDLRDYIDARGVQSEEERIRIITELAFGLDYLHAKDIAHRDFKSRNVLLTMDKTCKICDFGLSKETGNDTTAGSSLGTPAWSAPEILRGECREVR
ncbi:hypothetical protein GUITHDRAFT_72389 [Guillardia theta CCMP2712]|uniref:Protein kinase domain-containing protein n=1 Tax=Guillardia theta (strain CCMP2712) TaxID=905079 RepID=L1J7J7_GUITC|nr:hypothetical protein GUITHDRAFT_72389 [Guillardia theta CCMP2712]EKX44272.1 hypothetical protein GUITHDRAFT_72389 [Guillardia theta CCMP2712]|eukprot:XP_005831252.1 hypothetical protein GUITHDRAFT_72389 [Guillardia theta CCMP2712]